MFCEYSKKDDKNKLARIYCTITNKQCHLAYWCPDIGGWRNLDGLETKCNLYKNMKDKEYLKYGDYKVLYKKRNHLCVQLNKDKTIFVENPFGDDYPIGVNLINIDGIYCINKIND